MITRFQFRLRTLLIGVTLVAVPCAYVAHEARIAAMSPAFQSNSSLNARGPATIAE
jgi:hypothetical protein